MKKLSTSTIKQLEQDGSTVLDYSILRAFIACPRRFYYRHELGLVRKDAEPSFALEFGVALHSALQMWESSGRIDALAIKKFLEVFQNEEPSKQTKRGVQTPTYSKIYGCSLLSAYFQKYGTDTRKVLETEIAVGEELADRMFLVGRVDKILESKQGVVYADYKSTKYVDGLQTIINPQFMGYKYIVQKLLGVKVSGELDILPVTKTQDPAELLRRIPFDYSDYSMAKWRESVVASVQEIELCRHNKFFPQRWDCKPFFKDCTFLPLCTVQDDVNEKQLIASMYDVQHWDPFAEVD